MLEISLKLLDLLIVFNLVWSSVECILLKCIKMPLMTLFTTQCKNIKKKIKKKTHSHINILFDLLCHDTYYT